MAEDTRDTLMVIIVNGTAIDAEAQSELDDDDTLIPDEFDSGDYFAVEEFEIEIELLSEASESKPVTKEELQKALEATQKAAQKSKDGKGGDEASKASKFSKFLTKGSGGIRGRDAYSADLSPISITKRMDQSSLKIFDLCQKSTLIDKCVIIKRRAIGQQYLQTFMRIDLLNCLITDLDWDEDDVVKEAFKIVCREIKIYYRQENNDGSLGKVLGPKGWKILDLNRPA